jgi:hypothetical protein
MASDPSELDRHARERPPGLLAEFWEFISRNKKWWLLPIVVLLLLLAGLVFLSGTGAAPFIYTLF